MKKMNLQLFAEAAGEGTAAGTAQGTAEGTGEATRDAAGDGRSQEADSSAQDDTADERIPFEELIKGDYKKEFEEEKQAYKSVFLDENGKPYIDW